MGLLEKFIANTNFQQHHLLLAVSGGIDSVVLCELCHQAGYTFTIAHCNFQLRAEESDRDEAFVQQLGNKYGVPVLIKKFDTETHALLHRQSIQEAARELRYTWFNELLDTYAPAANSQLPTVNLLLTGHHADDNIETVLMNFFRGTGLHGLTGIPAINGRIRRPLLIFSREELVGFANESGLKHVEDSSNQSVKYTRNLFRNKIIPEIEEVYPQTKENLRANIDRFKEIEKLYHAGLGTITKKLCRQKGKEIHIPIKQLMEYNNKALVYEIISRYGFGEKQVDEVFKLANSESGSYIQSPRHTHRIIRHRHWFIISPVETKESDNIIIEAADSKIEFTAGLLQIETTTSTRPSTSNTVACLDMKLISFPLLLRRWKAGDYFYPLGMKKKKKVARFLIDQKLSKTDKENTWVIEMNKKIIWVVGHRIDDRFRITENTTKALRLELSTKFKSQN
jgi:tRNA(Ile)-lysidine synthase